MPNHIQNKLKLVGADLDISPVIDFMKSIDENGNNMQIDFNKILPMPESLNISSGSAIDYGIAILKYKNAGDNSDLINILSYPWVVKEDILTVDELVEYFSSKDDKTVDLKGAEIALNNIKLYSAKDWYDWRLRNWGTKWNAYSQNDDRNTKDTIYFQTAWSAPFMIIKKLSELFPSVMFDLLFSDEDASYNSGNIVFKNGKEIISNFTDGGSKEAFKLYFELHPGVEDYYTFNGTTYVYKDN